MPNDIDYLSRLSPTPTAAVAQWIADTTPPLPGINSSFDYDKPGGILTNLQDDMAAFDAHDGGKLDIQA